MKQVRLTFVFLVLNFGGLAIGNLLMNNGATSDWYRTLNKAPWTPPGWVFGAAWTIIMICFSVYLGKLFLEENTVKMKTIFSFHFILNASWNYLFFQQHLITLALINISLLTILVGYYFFALSEKVGSYKFLLTPYLVWLSVATSLNLYVLIYN